VEAKAPGLKDKALSALGTVLKPLDYLGGIGRTAAAGSIQGNANLVKMLRAMAKREQFNPIDVVKGEDVTAALKGEAPSSAEYMKRAGVPEGMKMSDALPGMYSETGRGLPLQKGGTFDPSVRGAAGFAADLATDPLTYVGAPAARAALQGAGKAGQIADRIFHPMEALLKMSGKKIYKSAPTMKAVDALAEQFKKGSVSDELFNQGVKGTGRQIAEQSGALAEQIGKERNALLKQADEAGAVLDMKQGMAPAQEMVDQITHSRDPNLQPLAVSLQEKINEYLALKASKGKPAKATINHPDLLDNAGNPIASKKPMVEPERGVTATEGSGYKSSLYNDTANAAWDTLRKTPTGDKAAKKLAKGLDAETTAAVDRATGKGAEVDALNDRWGKLLTTAKTFEKEARKGEGKNFFTSVDGMIAPFVAHNPALLASKKAADLAKTNWLRTHLGIKLDKMGGVQGLDEVLRRLLISGTKEQ
jgi:hypothetical protein